MADAPGAGGGKIRNRRSASTRKPYSRASSQRRSLFSRVTDSFKSLLNPITPKWLSNRLHHDGSPLPSAGVSEQTSVADSEAASTSANHQQHHTNNNYKKSPLCRPPLSAASTSRLSLQCYVTPPDTPPHEEVKKLSTGGKDKLLEHLAMSSKRPKFSHEPVLSSSGLSTPSKGMDLLKVDDNGSVASSSGCSSSMQASQRSTSAEQEGSQRNLWSSSMESVASSRASSHQQATMTSNKRPRFNPAVFGLPALGSPSRSQDVLHSSFYNGPIQFGGANASVRQPYFATPYKIPSVTKVKVRHVNHQRTPASTSMISRGSRSPLDESSIGGISSTARKILQTLETMPSPLNDARRIPSVTRTPSSFLAARQRRRTIGGSSMLGSTSKGPPVAGFSTPSSVKIRKRAHIPLNTSLLNRTAKQASDELARDRPSTSGGVPDSKVLSTRGVPAPLASLSSTASMPKPKPYTYLGGEPSTSGAGGGKMKTQKRSSAHYSATHEEDDEITPDLPKVSLPLPSNLPSFNFGKSGMTSTPAVRMIEKHVPTQPQFNFASPVVRTSKIEQPQSSDCTPKFQFSSPPTKKSSTSNEHGTPSSQSGTTFNAGTNQSTPSLVFAPDPKVVSALRTNKRRSSPLAVLEPAKTSGGGFGAAENLKPGSVMDILSGGSKKSENMPGVDTPTSAFHKDSFKPLAQSKSGWDCGTCLVSNDAGTDKCAACETPKPGVNSGQLTASDNKPWGCEVCLVSNDPGTKKCAACETPKPGLVLNKAPKLGSGMLGGSGFKLGTSSNFSFGIPTTVASATEQKKTVENKTKSDSMWGGAFSKKDTWDCGVCLVSNDSSSNKCEACQNPKPGAAPKSSANETIVSAKPQFKFGIPSTSSSEANPSGWGLKSTTKSGTWECEVCMVPNSNDRKTCEACESPKPGTEKKKPSLDTSFKFGENTSGLFKFGVPDNEPKKSEPEKKTEQIKEKQEKTQSKVTFGILPKEDSSVSGPAKPSVPTFNFGPPAAASATKLSTSEPPAAKKPTPTFSFGLKPAQDAKKEDTEGKPPALFSFGAPKTTPKTTEVTMPAFGAPSPATPFGAQTSTTSATPPVAQSTGFSGTASASSAKRQAGFNPLLGGAATSQLTTASATAAFPAQTQSTASGNTLFGGFKPNDTDLSSKPEPPKPAFSFGASQPSSGSSFQFSGSSQPKPAESAPTTGFTFGVSKPAVPVAPPGEKNSVFGGFGAGQSSAPTKPQEQNASKPGFTGFGFGASSTSTQSSSGSIFGSTAPNQAPFGSGLQGSKPSPFGTPASKAAPFGASSTSGTSAAFGATSAPAFGATAPASNSGIPKPSFAFGGAPANDSSQKPAGGFPGFQFNANTPKKSTGTPGGAFAFGASATKPAPAYNSTAQPTTFQFGASSSQPESNGMFQFGAGGSQPKNATVPETKPFVFGGNNQAGPAMNQQTASTGFNFGAVPGGGFSFTGSQPTTPQGGGSMFGVGESAPNANPFSASGSRSTTPQPQGGRRIRQARRKLRK